MIPSHLLIETSEKIKFSSQIHPSHGALYIPYGGKEHAFKQGYEILVSRDRRPPRPPPPIPMIQNQSNTQLKCQKKIRDLQIFSTLIPTLQCNHWITIGRILYIGKIL